MWRNRSVLACLLALCTLCCVPGLTAAFKPAGNSLKAQRQAVQKLQQKLWKVQLRFHHLLSDQHEQQLEMGRLRLKQHMLYIQQNRLQQKHLKLQMRLRRLQLQQIRLQMELSKRRAVMHRARAARMARRKAAAKMRPTASAKKLERWLGYMVSPATPVGPRMVMQHPLVARRQSYANLVTRQGKFIRQAIVVFGLVKPPPANATGLISFSGTTRTIGPLPRRPRVKGAGYSGLVIRVRAWKFVKAP